MFARVWHGWTTKANAGKYQDLLRAEIFAGIRERRIPEFRSIRLLSRETPGGEVEFATIMEFDSLEAVREFAGEDYAAAVVTESARALLARFDERSQHYDILV